MQPFHVSKFPNNSAINFETWYKIMKLPRDARQQNLVNRCFLASPAIEFDLNEIV